MRHGLLTMAMLLIIAVVVVTGSLGAAETESKVGAHVVNDESNLVVAETVAYIEIAEEQDIIVAPQIANAEIVCALSGFQPTFAAIVKPIANDRLYVEAD